MIAFVIKYLRDILLELLDICEKIQFHFLGFFFFLFNVTYGSEKYLHTPRRHLLIRFYFHSIESVTNYEI